MPIRVLHFDVFTRTPGKGNPAGIVLSGESLDQRAMQAVAASTGFGDTAFISPSTVADFRIRYFSPRREVALCGHATIAASIALRSSALQPRRAFSEKFSLETNAGVLPIEVDEGASGELMVFMNQAPSDLRKFEGDRDLLLRCLGISAGDLHPSSPAHLRFNWSMDIGGSCARPRRNAPNATATRRVCSGIGRYASSIRSSVLP